jgi:lipopolysaccharide biosynthesis regulator YciM
MMQPGMSARLRKLAAAGQGFEAVAKMLEKLAAEMNSPEEFSVELARLYGDWAQSELAAVQPESALAHLRKAHERHPELLDVTLRLSRLQHERGDRKAAIETLESFLAVAKIGTEIDQAREQLARLKAGG